MSKLIQVKLQNVSTNFDNMRIPLSVKDREKLEKKYRYYGAQGVIDNVDDYIFDGEYILIAEDGENLKSQKNNICNYVTGKFWVNNHAHIIKASQDNNTKYLYYKLSLVNFKNYVTGSAQPKLTKDNLNSIILYVHKPYEQQKIAAVLSSLDAKIELNNRINAQLEQIAKTLYDYWFVQFDFPNKDGKPYKSSGGKMVYNEVLKREIPEGWKVSTIVTLIESDKSGDWGKEEAQGNYTKRVLCIRGADINGINGKGELACPVRFILEKNSNKVLKPFDIVIEISGGSPTQSTGRMAFITKRTIIRFNESLICSNFCKAISLKNNNYFYYFTYLWNSIYDENILFGWEGKTSGIKNLLFDAFVQNHKVVIPKEDVAEKFFDFIEKIQDKKQKNLSENQQLTQLRDWLLPMLMNGQVRVN